ncbi:glycerophosphodiester phosphodiesterase [Patescibacteria group bacterium]
MIKSDLTKPLTMAHAGGIGHGRENTLEAVLAVNKHNPDIIELDIRKSKDGILFCYHGTGILGFIKAYFLQFSSFSSIKKLIKVDTLEKILSSIQDRKIFFLDIKQRNITSQDISDACNDDNHEIWIAAFSLKYLKKLKNELGNKYKYIYNFGFLQFKKGLRKANKSGIDAFQIFSWQCNKTNTGMIGKLGLSFAIWIGFISKKRYLELINKYGSLWICKDSFPHEHKTA